MADISNLDDIVDVRGVIDRIEELRASREEYDNFHNTPGAWALIDDGEAEELATLESLLNDCQGTGGDEKWEGQWYPSTLIRDSHFESYAQELAEDIGAVKSDAAWPNNCIDWKEAARELQYDYTSVEFGDVTYWYR